MYIIETRYDNAEWIEIKIESNKKNAKQNFNNTMQKLINIGADDCHTVYLLEINDNNEYIRKICRDKQGFVTGKEAEILDTYLNQNAVELEYDCPCDYMG